MADAPSAHDTAGPQPADDVPVDPRDEHAVDRVVDPALGNATGLRATVEESIKRLSGGRPRVTELLERHKARPVLDVALRFVQRDRESAGTIVGSALAFRLFLFFAPLLLCAVGILGFVASWADGEDINQAAGVSGSLAVQINSALTQPDSTRWAAALVGLFGMFWAGRSLSKVMVTASCLAWQLPLRARAPVRVIGAVVGLFVGIGLVAAIVNRIRLELGLAAAGLSFLAAFAIYALTWIVMSTLLPRATKDPGALLPGAVLVSAALAGMQAVSQLYLPDKIERASQLYGAIGTTLVTLGWFFILGRAIVLGMSLDAVIYERFGSVSQFVFSLPLVRILRQRSSWIRRFFDLDQ
ncbi:MAG: YhjD/YihY/BrkB family envelope integrity protein [Acidimicrobiales bacterium]